MPASDERSPSTTWAWELRKIPVRPKGPSSAAPKAASGPALPRRNPRDPLTVTVTYRGGPEAWYEVKARGRTWRFPGHVAIHDAWGRIIEGDAANRG